MNEKFYNKCQKHSRMGLRCLLTVFTLTVQKYIYPSVPEETRCSRLQSIKSFSNYMNEKFGGEKKNQSHR